MHIHAKYWADLAISLLCRAPKVKVADGVLDNAGLHHPKNIQKEEKTHLQHIPDRPKFFLLALVALEFEKYCPYKWKAANPKSMNNNSLRKARMKRSILSKFYLKYVLQYFIFCDRCLQNGSWTKILGCQNTQSTSTNGNLLTTLSFHRFGLYFLECCASLTLSLYENDYDFLYSYGSFLGVWEKVLYSSGN